MSRLYDNQPLKNLPVINIQHTGHWSEDTFKRGDGVLLEGTIQGRSHFAITDGASSSKVHYYVFHIKISRAHYRRFDSTGKEIEPNFSETKKVSKGFLNSSYVVEARGQTDRLSAEDALSLVSVSDLTKHTQKHTPSGCASLWIKGDKCAGIELENGDSVRVKTDGSGPFIYSIAKLDDQSSTVSNYAGGASVGASWTDKIMDMKGSESQQGLQENEGAEDDEWDD